MNRLNERIARRDMRRPAGLAIAGLALASLACGTRDQGDNHGGSSDAATLVRLELGNSSDALAVEEGRDIQLEVVGVYDDASRRNETANATFTSADDAIATFDSNTPGLLHGHNEGAVRVSISVDATTAEFPLTVTAATPTGLEIVAAEPTLAIDVPTQLVARLTFERRDPKDVTTLADWSSSDDSVLTVGNEDGKRGLATARKPGSASVSASYAGFTADAAFDIACTYPKNDGAVDFDGGILPNVYWEGAYREDGTQFRFAVEDVYCKAPGFEDTKILIIVIGAGWCAPCVEYTQNLNAQSAAIIAAGGQIVYLEAEGRTQGSPASTDFAFENIGRIIGNGPGIRVGDNDTKPTRNVFHDADDLVGFPSILVVRTRDMKIITNQYRSNYMLPFARIAADPEADWSYPDFRNKCGAKGDETYEPNDTMDQAALIEPGTFSGGICVPTPDFYRIELPGRWRVDVAFAHSDGDLDVYVWDPATNQPLEHNGQRVGSESTDDDESFEHEGPATVLVYGFDGASAPYTFTLTAL